MTAPFPRRTRGYVISYKFINRTLGDYLLLCRLAVGGQSEVFLAQKRGPGEFDRPVVIKALPSEYGDDETFVSMFHREAFLSARFSHPHVITVHDARVLEGEQCMLMDFISGQTVADVAQRAYKAGSPPSREQAVRIVADACDGLHYTHQFRGLDETEYPVVHRDVSPQNLMVTYQGNTLVFDFGIAKVVDRDSPVDTLAGGKYAYMSPEQCLGREVDTRSDIFSLGAILYELTVGTRLFRRDSKDEVIEAVTEDRIEPPGTVESEFPTMLEDIVMRALERDPDRRYQTAGQMRDDLREFLSLQGGDEGRAALGSFVAELFDEERADIADLVDRAKRHDADPEPVGDIPLEKLGRGDVELEEESPVSFPDGEDGVPGAVRDDGEAMEENDERRDTSRVADESAPPAADDETGSGGEPAAEQEDAEALRNELQTMRKRQAMLFVALAIVSLLAIGLSVLNVMLRMNSSEEPVEIEASEHPDSREG